VVWCGGGRTVWYLVHSCQWPSAAASIFSLTLTYAFVPLHSLLAASVAMSLTLPYYTYNYCPFAHMPITVCIHLAFAGTFPPTTLLPLPAIQKTTLPVATCTHCHTYLVLHLTPSLVLSQVHLHHTTGSQCSDCVHFIPPFHHVTYIPTFPVVISHPPQLTLPHFLHLQFTCPATPPAHRFPAAHLPVPTYCLHVQYSCLPTVRYGSVVPPHHLYHHTCLHLPALPATRRFLPLLLHIRAWVLSCLFCTVHCTAHLPSLFSLLHSTC